MGNSGVDIDGCGRFNAGDGLGDFGVNREIGGGFKTHDQGVVDPIEMAAVEFVTGAEMAVGPPAFRGIDPDVAHFGELAGGALPEVLHQRAGFAPARAAHRPAGVLIGVAG